MYMYYLLCFRFFGDLEQMEKLYHSETTDDPADDDSKKEFKGFGNLLQNIDTSLRTKVIP